jgi:phenylalanyl-tRNA synthetase beta chain
VARVRGYEQTPGTLPDTPMPHFRPSPLEARDEIRSLLAGAGVSEVVTHALVPPDRDERLNWPIAAADGVPGEGDAAFDTIRVVNPLSSQHSVLRRDVVGSLLDVASANLRQGRDDVAIHEIGKGYGLVGGAPHEWWRLGIVLTGAAEPRSWNRPLRGYDLDDAKGLIELICRELGFGRPTYAPFREGFPLHPGRSARVSAAPAGGAGVALAGVVGELHPDLLERWEIRAERVIAADLAIAGLSGGQLPAVKVSPVPRFPAVERDLAVAVEAGRPAADLEAAIRSSAGDLLRDVRLFDVYAMADGRRSLAFRLQFQPPDRTLTEQEIDDTVASVVRALEAAGGRLRS